MGVGEIPESAAEIGDSLVRLVYKAAAGNPGYPTPIKAVEAGEIEIEFPASPLRSDGEISMGRPRFLRS